MGELEQGAVHIVKGLLHLVFYIANERATEVQSWSVQAARKPLADDTVSIKCVRDHVKVPPSHEAQLSFITLN